MQLLSLIITNSYIDRVCKFVFSLSQQKLKMFYDNKIKISIIIDVYVCADRRVSSATEVRTLYQLQLWVIVLYHSANYHLV